MRWFTLGGTCIYSSPSGYKVYDNYFFRWLTLDSNVLQTVINKKYPYHPVLYYLPALTLMARAIPTECCLLGLGGAAAIQALSQLTSHITAVEKSLEVIDIAKRYFMVGAFDKLTIIHQSAELYLEECRVVYPHLLVDLYNAQSFPSECANEYFFYQCKKKLTGTGFLAINLANPKDHRPILQLIKKHFSNTLIIPIKKTVNAVILASNHPSNNEFIQKILDSGEIKKIAFVASWGCVGIIQ